MAQVNIEKSCQNKAEFMYVRTTQGGNIRIVQAIILTPSVLYILEQRGTVVPQLRKPLIDEHLSKK